MVTMTGDMRSLGKIRHGTVRPLALARWLFAVAALIAMIVVVGGITRLTESGLSIVEWKPVTGILPHSATRNGRPSSRRISASRNTPRSMVRRG